MKAYQFRPNLGSIQSFFNNINGQPLAQLASSGNLALMEASGGLYNPNSARYILIFPGTVGTTGWIHGISLTGEVDLGNFINNFVGNIATLSYDNSVSFGMIAFKSPIGASSTGTNIDLATPFAYIQNIPFPSASIDFSVNAGWNEFIHSINSVTNAEYVSIAYVFYKSDVFTDRYSFPAEYTTVNAPRWSYRLELTDVSNTSLNFLNRLNISALPFRAYESIYNSFYRDIQNDPWLIDGVPQYNNYCTTHEDGADSTPYHLFQRNWEKDFLTSATPSPQQGLAPLVGITSTGRMIFETEEGTLESVQAIVADDGETIIGFKAGSASQPVRASAMELASAGISINSFRNVNALIRFLENNMRRGLKYKDQLLANTGVEARFDELDMPEFLGGYSRSLDVNQVTQMMDNGPDSPLGSFGGLGYLSGGSEHNITTFCDEDGFIMGILCVTPQPVYSQLLPKMFLKNNALDYYNETFSHIGKQPITYAEVCPLQALAENVDLNSVFGYQRPWYDLISSVDEVHGLMRTSMRDFVMRREFASVPELSPEFLHVDPTQLNQVFSYTDGNEDVMMGRIIFQIYKKTAIPRFGIPRLEA